MNSSMSLWRCSLLTTHDCSTPKWTRTTKSVQHNIVGFDPDGFERSAEDWSAERDDSVISWEEVPIEWITEDLDNTNTDKKLSLSSSNTSCKWWTKFLSISVGKMRTRFQSLRNLWHQQARQTPGSNPVMIGANGVHDPSTSSRNTSW